MRVVLVAALLASATASAETALPEIKANADKVEVWRDELGWYYVVPVYNAFPKSEAVNWLFYGDTKNMYQQRVIGFATMRNTYEWSIWAPRAQQRTADVATKNGHLTLQCGDTVKRQLTRLEADEARAVVAKVTFGPPLWKRSAEFLARDDGGAYYYVDRMSDEAGGNGFRLFTGLKGAMKEQPITNRVTDTAGSLYASKAGTLKITTKGDDADAVTAVWIKNGKKTTLTVVSALENGHLVYRELGIYTGSLGAPCDDL